MTLLPNGTVINDTKCCWKAAKRTCRSTIRRRFNCRWQCVHRIARCVGQRSAVAATLEANAAGEGGLLDWVAIACSLCSGGPPASTAWTTPSFGRNITTKVTAGRRSRTSSRWTIRTTRKRTGIPLYTLPHSCFAAGTQIMTADGPRAIEEIKVGDRVLSQNVALGRLDLRPCKQPHCGPTCR